MFESAHHPVQDMHLTSLHRDDLLPRAPDGIRRGLLLAVAAHVVLVAGIAFNVNWSSSEPAGVEAELWAAVPQIAAQRAAALEPAPAEPRPAPKPEPRPVPKPPVESPPPKPAPDPQIAIEREKLKKEKLREEKQRADREAEKLEKLAEQKREREEKLRDEKKLADQKKKQQQTQAQAQAEAQREAQLKRILAQAGADNGSPGGKAERTAGPSSGYAGRINGVVKPNIIRTSEINGNPAAIVEVQLGPDGTIVGRKLTRSSGVPEWDNIVLRALDKTERLPLDGGRVITPMELTFRPQD